MFKLAGAEASVPAVQQLPDARIDRPLVRRLGNLGRIVAVGQEPPRHRCRRLAHKIGRIGPKSRPESRGVQIHERLAVDQKGWIHARALGVCLPKGLTKIGCQYKPHLAVVGHCWLCAHCCIKLGLLLWLRLYAAMANPKATMKCGEVRKSTRPTKKIMKLYCQNGKRKLVHAGAKG